jgi:hypothetical protein
MGRKARAVAITEFTTERVIPQYIQLYERVALEADKKARSQGRTG